MAVNINDLLPIGTVVSLKGAEKRLMIFGIKQISASEKENIEFDYAGVLYPEGNLGENMTFLFNHEDIDLVHFIGYADAERQVFIAQLSESYPDNKSKE